jgi:hypothetical protein
MNALSDELEVTLSDEGGVGSSVGATIVGGWWQELQLGMLLAM